MIENKNVEEVNLDADILEDDDIVKTKNIFPEDHKYITFLKKVFRHEFRKNGFRRISTPFFEKRSFFDKIFPGRVDENIVKFNLEGNGCIWLNPAPCIFNLKAYIEWERSEEIQPVYSYFMDRFYSKNDDDSIEWKALFGWEIIWENDVIIDIQNLFTVSNIFNKIGLSWEYEIRYNYTWTKKEIEKYKENLADFYSDKKHLLTEKGLYYLENDILKLLSTDNEDEQILAKSAPSIVKCYKKDSKKEAPKAKEFLELLNLDYIEDTTLFGDYDFNDWVIWEISLKDWWEILSKWYWYNELSNLMWTPKEIPGSWFWVDIFKIVNLLKKKNIAIKNKDSLDLFFVQLWDDAKKVVFPLSVQAREAWIKVAVSLWTPSMKEQMLKAQRSKATYIVMVWLMEARNWIFQVRNLEAWTQEEVKKEDLIDYIIEKIWKDSLDFYDPSRDLLVN